MDVDEALLKELRISGEHEPQWAFPRWLVPAASATSLLAATATGYAFSAEKPIDVRTVQASQVESRASQQLSVLEASGYVVARRMATVSSQITGRVMEVLIEEGQYVQAAEVLARLDPVTAEAEHRLAQSQLDSTHGSVASLQAQVREATSKSSRLEQPVQKQLISRTQYEQSIALKCRGRRRTTRRRDYSRRFGVDMRRQESGFCGSERPCAPARGDDRTQAGRHGRNQYRFIWRRNFGRHPASRPVERHTRTST